LNSIKAWLTLKAKSLDVLGLIILGTEGLNTTLASQNVEKLDQFVKEVSQFIEFDEFSIKKSESERAPFRKFVVKLRPEIVSLGKPEFVPSGTHQHLSPEQWHEMLEKDVVVVDTRNDYEIEIGTFKNAVDLEMKEFSEFPDKIAQLDSDKEKPHLIFCTGGIRCEKAIFEMEQQGYKQVYQLDGGILNYMEAFPEGHFEGECFVFDSRVSVDQNLKPSSQYSLCPQCGEVGSVPISCRKCGEVSKLCKSCLEISKEKPEYETCSKNCRHHYKLRPDVKGPQQKAFYHFKA
ncbi:MAG: rhodanese-like domain-containing protein, partial [Pseudomonadota bacterium]